MKQNNPDNLKHALRKRSRNCSRKGRIKVKHECPVCRRLHWALTDLCFICKRNAGSGNYELVFNTEIEREMFENTISRIRMEEQILRSKGYDPNRINSVKADRILRKAYC